MSPNSIFTATTWQDWSAKASFACFLLLGLRVSSTTFHPTAVHAITMSASDESVGQQDDLANHMGLFLQKVNIIRDYLEDIVDGRTFWPRSIWGKYVGKLSDLKEPKNVDLAVKCLNEMIVNALQHAPHCLKFMSILKNPDVFRFCAIPQMIAIATLAKITSNPNVFTGVVKIRKVSNACLYAYLACTFSPLCPLMNAGSGPGGETHLRVR